MASIAILCPIVAQSVPPNLLVTGTYAATGSTAPSPASAGSAALAGGPTVKCVITYPGTPIPTQTPVTTLVASNKFNCQFNNLPAGAAQVTATLIDPANPTPPLASDGPQNLTVVATGGQNCPATLP